MNEIKALPDSLGFKGFLNGDVITYGCRTFKLNDYQKLYDTLIQFGIKSYSIPYGKDSVGEIQTTELGEILRVANS